jgi:cell division protease FtsH
MGHALVAAVLPGTDAVHKVSIIPRGIGALGYTLQRPTEDRYLMTREDLESKLAVLLGGRAAEDLVFGELSTGASDDLARATHIARTMATQYGMVPDLGNVTYEEDTSGMLDLQGLPTRTRRYSEETAREIDCAVREIVDGAFDRAREILGEHRATLEKSARDLLERESLTEEALRPYFEAVRAQDR